jgi:hypothetical protein
MPRRHRDLPNANDYLANSVFRDAGESFPQFPGVRSISVRATLKNPGFGHDPGISTFWRPDEPRWYRVYPRRAATPRVRAAGSERTTPSGR